MMGRVCVFPLGSIHLVEFEIPDFFPLSLNSHAPLPSIHAQSNEGKKQKMNI